MPNGTLLGLLGVACLSLLADCAVVQSQAVQNKGPDGTLLSVPVPSGLPYFLPRRPFIITVTMPQSGSGAPTIAVTPGVAEPDLSARYVLSQGVNLVADNEFTISVGSNGLLKSSNSTAISEVATTVQGIAATAGTFIPGLALSGKALLVQKNFFAPLPNAPSPSPRSIGCPAAGASYQVIIYPEKSDDQGLMLCSRDFQEGGPYTVTWHRADIAAGGAVPTEPNPFGGKNGNNNDAYVANPVSGIFFRHELPYFVSVKGGGNPASENDTVVTSPDESETNFFPVKHSFFANNTANITIADGVITGVDQTTKSEVAAAFSLPATILSSYMTAVGQLFSGFSSVSSDQQKMLQQMLATSATQNQAAAVTAAQNQLCAKTVASYPLATMSASDIATALPVIKAACPGS